MSSVDLGEELSNSVITIKEELVAEEYEVIEEEEEEEEKEKPTACRPPKKGVYKPIQGEDYIQLERLEQFGNFPDTYMRRLRAYIMRGYSFSEAQGLLKTV